MAKAPSSLRKEFRISLNVFLAVCKEKGIEPTKEFSGKFNLRIPPRLHSEISVKAAAANKSINQWVAEVLEESVGE